MRKAPRSSLIRISSVATIIISVAAIGLAAMPAAGESNPCDPILSSIRKQVSGPAFRTRTTIVHTDSGPSMLLQGEFIPPDRVHLITDRQELIAILNKGTFIKPKNGSWQQSPVDMSETLLSFRDPKVIDQLAKDYIKSDCKQVGSETLNGQETTIWQYKTSGLSATTRIWINASDELPYKQEIEGDAAGHKSKTTQLIEYDPGIRIEPPIQ